MGNKKRVSSSLEEVKEVDKQVDSIFYDNDNVTSEPSTKKLKKGKKRKETERGNDFDAPSNSHSDKVTSVKPMERKKKRKALDKEKHHLEAKANNPNQMGLELKENLSQTNESSPGTSGSNNVLPEFHIGVFKDLASADASVREVAAEALVRELQAVQKAYDKLENKDEVEGALKLEADKDDGLNNCAPSLRYAVRRLIRGVSSSRECARQGFALGLTVLVGAVPNIKVDSLLKLIVNLLEVSSSMKGQEARECLLGQLFAYGALARSGRITKDWDSNNSTSYIKDFTSSLISLAAQKRYLQEPAVSIILELVEKLPVKALLDKVLEAPGLQDWFEGAIETGNPDALLLALKMREKVGIHHGVFGKLLPSEYSTSKLFSADYLSLVSNCLKESTFCQPRLHCVWPVLVNILLPDMFSQDVESASTITSVKKYKKGRKGCSAEEDAEKNLQCFCEVIIEGSLLTSSHDRKHLAFDILLQLFPRLTPSCVQVVLSYKFIQCLVDILSTKDSWLYKVAQHFLKELSEWVKNDDGKRVAVIVALQKHSNGRFDCITRTKTVKVLMAEFKSESGCLLFVQELLNLFLDEGHTSEEPSDQSQTTDDNSEIGSLEDKNSVGITGTSDFLKSWVVDSLPCVLKHSKLDPEARFKVQKEILKFLAVQGLFCSSLGTEVTSFELQEKFRWPKSSISSALSRMCIEQLELLLANAQKGESPHAVASGLESNDLGSYFMRFLGTLCNIPSVSLFRSLNDDDEKAFKKLQAMETQLSREERNCGLSMEANKLHALRYFLIQLLLQILLRPGEFHEAAAELIICCKRAFGTSDLLDSSGDDEPSGDGIPDIMDVLVDTMLSLLPQSSAPLRSTIEQVFKYFCNDVTEDGLAQMLRVIKKDLKPARHQETGSEDEDDDEDDLLDIEEAEESDEAETGETADSDEQTDDSEAVAGVEAATTELPETSDDSDGGMDDDAMFRMDTYLARIFKERKNQVGSETAQSQLVLFKLRVLSLLEIYLHENPGKPQVLKVFSNLAQAFVNPHATEGSEQLGQRIWGILQKKIFKAKEYPRGEAVPLSVLESLLEKNLKLAAKPFKKKKVGSITSSKKHSASWNRHKMITSLAQNSTFWVLLKYAGRAKEIRTHIQKNIRTINTHVSDYQRMIDTLQNEVSRLRKELSEKESQLSAKPTEKTVDDEMSWLDDLSQETSENVQERINLQKALFELEETNLHNRNELQQLDDAIAKQQEIEKDGAVVPALRERRQVILDNIRDNDELGVHYQMEIEANEKRRCQLQDMIEEAISNNGNKTYLRILSQYRVLGIANTELQFEMAMRDQVIYNQREAQRNLWNLLLSLGLDEKQIVELAVKQGITIEDCITSSQVGPANRLSSSNVGWGRYSSPSSCSTNNEFHDRAPSVFPQHQDLSARSFPVENWKLPRAYCGEEHHSSYCYMSNDQSPSAYMRLSSPHWFGNGPISQYGTPDRSLDLRNSFPQMRTIVSPYIDSAEEQDVWTNSIRKQNHVGLHIGSNEDTQRRMNMTRGGTASSFFINRPMQGSAIPKPFSAKSKPSNLPETAQLPPSFLTSRKNSFCPSSLNSHLSELV